MFISANMNLFKQQVLRHPGIYSKSYGDVETAYLTDANSLLNIALQEDNLHKAVQLVTAFIKNMEENQFINKTERTRVNIDFSFPIQVIECILYNCCSSIKKFACSCVKNTKSKNYVSDQCS